MNHKMDLTIRCVECQTPQTVSIKPGDFEKYKTGHGNIQDIFPYLLPAEREMLMSRICGDCWDRMFADHDEDW